MRDSDSSSKTDSVRCLLAPGAAGFNIVGDEIFVPYYVKRLCEQCANTRFDQVLTQCANTALGLSDSTLASPKCANSVLTLIHKPSLRGCVM